MEKDYKPTHYQQNIASKINKLEIICAVIIFGNCGIKR